MLNDKAQNTGAACPVQIAQKFLRAFLGHSNVRFREFRKMAQEGSRKWANARVSRKISKKDFGAARNEFHLLN